MKKVRSYFYRPLNKNLAPGGFPTAGENTSKEQNILKGYGSCNNLGRISKLFRWAAFAGGICIVIFILTFLAMNTWPAFGAQGADLLRSLFGDKAVAGLEMKFNQMQDGLQKLKFELGLETPAAPWDTAQIPARTALVTETVTSTPEIQTPPFLQIKPTLSDSKPPQPTNTPAPSIWRPVNLTPMGGAEGEGLWSDYIQDAAGHTVAYRTFVQPDPDRPYTLVAIVAVDLTRTRLHYVLGTAEPTGESTLPRSGAIPPADRVANVLLAAFNGGFQARHGQSGAMADGVVALPPRDGFGTLLIFQNGRVSLVEWGPGSAITPAVDAFRQNGPLVIQAGLINPRIHNNSPQDWGYTVIDVSPTVRTGVGLSEDEKTLFYFCGPSLSMEMLARSMQSAGTWNAIQLDINNYWALFVKFQSKRSELIPEALLPRMMVADIERYLWNYDRDYFYITSTLK